MFKFILSALAIFNDASTMDQLQNKLVELRDAANNIQARADAEKRELTADEQTEVTQIFSSFENVEADIGRREQLDSINARIAEPTGRRTNPEITENDSAATIAAAAAPAKKAPYNSGAKIYAGDPNKWGFRTNGDYLTAVVASSRKGAQTDPRLIANAPTTFGTEGTGADGGFAVPPDFRSAIISKVMGEDSLIALTEQLTTSSNSITFPADETTPWQTSGGIQAYWESEGGQKNQSKPALVEKTIKANKIIALVPLTDELLEDGPAMSGYVNRKAPEKIGFRLNDAILNGTGIGMPLGILQSAGTVVVAKETSQTADTINFTNIVKLYAALTPSARLKAKWIMNPDVEQQLMTMSFPGTGTAVPAYMPPGGLSGAPYGTLLGRPIISSEASAALGDQGDILIGDMSNYQTVVKAGGIRSDVSIHLWFDYDITAFRFVLRVGGQPLWNTAITAYQSGSSARGFFATLAARA